MTKGDLQEALVVLYLRLNGYFTTGFIVHSPTPHQVTTEVDILAVRFPNNAEPQRGIGCAPDLEPWNGGIDFVIAEVKSRGQDLQFNAAVRNADAVSTILRWWGHLTAEEIAEKAPEVLSLLQPRPNAIGAPTTHCARNARVRSVLFSPERSSRRRQQAWFIPGPPMFRYIFDCLHPPMLRPTCATDYGAGQWGIALSPLVAYFKTAVETAPTCLKDLLGHFQITEG
jgi:hypothetical protein